MIFSVKTNKTTENGTVVFHFAYNQFWFEDDRYSLGDVSNLFDIQEVLGVHAHCPYYFNSEDQVYFFKD